MKFSNLVTAKQQVDLVALEDFILKDIFDETEYNAEEAIQWIIFHCVHYEGVEYICSSKEGDLFVDICNRDDEIQLDEGPFAGYSISFPQPENY